jgi:acyl-CoA synthetase (AMP-forming)/AMP-acid ligase II
VVDALLSSARSEHPGAFALVWEGTTLTFSELSDAADRLARELGVAPGQRVAVVAPNVPALVVGMCASWRAGAVPVPLSARLRRFELERAFADAEPAAAVAVAAHAAFRLGEEVKAIAQGSPSLGACLLVDELGQVRERLAQRVKKPAPPSHFEVAAILYTSGTTGEPKGALLPHGLAEALGRTLAELLGDDAGSPFGLAAPASHAFGLGCLLAGMAGAATAVMIDVTTSIDPLLAALRAHGARALHGSPALLGRLERAGAKLSLRTGFVAGSWCPPELLRAFDERGARILNLYGMTETGAIACCRQDDPPQTRFHTVGRPVSPWDLRVVAPARTGPQDAQEGPGEIQVRSRSLPSGYHRRPWGPEELAHGGWFRTGDLGKLDASGNLTIAGRAKELVNVGGFNVFPAEVESFLLMHPAVAQAAVIGTPHPVLGEALQAFVAPAPGATLEPRDVIRFARAGIAGYKVPYKVSLVDELPLLASGKPDRRALAAATESAEVTP